MEPNTEAFLMAYAIKKLREDFQNAADGEDTDKVIEEAERVGYPWIAQEFRESVENSKKEARDIELNQRGK